MANQRISNLYPRPTPGVTDQTLAVDNTTGGVQFSAFNSLTRYVVLDVQTADVRVTYDDSAPTSTNGHVLFAGRSYTWNVDTARAAKFIEDTTTDAVIHASEFTD